jgi:hypothetical protein
MYKIIYISLSLSAIYYIFLISVIDINAMILMVMALIAFRNDINNRKIDIENTFLACTKEPRFLKNT